MRTPLTTAYQLSSSCALPIEKEFGPSFRLNVRFGSLADMLGCGKRVRFAPAIAPRS